MPLWSDPPAFTFSHRLENGHTASHDVYVRGEAGPPILILQELPGIGPETYELADRLIDAGFRVYLPHLLGKLGAAGRFRAAVNGLRLLCIRREFQLFWTGRQSPIAAWMRALCAEISAREGGAQLGVIGMCLTGCFVIPLMAEDAVKGAVASQPALPMRHADKLHMSAGEVFDANAAMDQKGCAMAMRFASDRISKPEHLAALQAAFGENLETHVLENPPGKPGRAHSILTLDFSEEGYTLMERYFKARFAMG